MANPRLKDYFNTTYAGRSHVVGKLLLRHGEHERARIVREWVPSTLGLRILDAGCDDGVFLARVISGRPAEIVCEDISPSAVYAAARNLEGKADSVVGTVCDSLSKESGSFDVVLAIGVLDYCREWKKALAHLLRRSAGTVIINLPRRDHPRNWVRWLWLSSRGVSLQLLSRKRVIEAAASLGVSCEIRLSRFEIFVRIVNRVPPV